MSEQPPYGGPPQPYGQPPYGQPPYNQPPYNQPPYNQPPYSQQPYAGGYPAQRGTNGMAVASMVLGILWLVWLGSLLALIFGYVARRQIRESGQSGDGMAIAGIVLGWVGAGTLGLMILFALLGTVTVTL